jgi:hypothetical protein
MDLYTYLKKENKNLFQRNNQDNGYSLKKKIFVNFQNLSFDRQELNYLNRCSESQLKMFLIAKKNNIDIFVEFHNLAPVGFDISTIKNDEVSLILLFGSNNMKNLLKDKNTDHIFSNYLL